MCSRTNHTLCPPAISAHPGWGCRVTAQGGADMNRLVRSQPRARYLVAALVAALAAGGGWAFAAGGSTLHACARKKTGALRLARRCKRTERAVAWNTEGPRGA